MLRIELRNSPNELIFCMNNSFLIHLLMGGILFGTPLLIAALGELIAERSGVLNLGVEGMMLVGAVSGFWASQRLGATGLVSMVIAFVVAGAAGGLMALIHAIASITLQANQIVSGLALAIFGGAFGLSTYIGDAARLAGSPGLHQINAVNLFGLGDLPIIGPLLFHQPPLVYASWALVALVTFYLFHTRFGLHLRAVGESPAAADAMGINIVAYRYIHTIAGGAFAGVAGASYSLMISPSWNHGMTAGAGWIAIALVVFAFWNPRIIIVGAYLFGTMTGLGFALQAHGIQVAPEFFSALPYLVTIVALVGISKLWAKGHIKPPAALAVPYAREQAS
jgi:simple sugar transport system permease protein